MEQRWRRESRCAIEYGFVDCIVDCDAGVACCGSACQNPGWVLRSGTDGLVARLKIPVGAKDWWNRQETYRDDALERHLDQGWLGCSTPPTRVCWAQAFRAWVTTRSLLGTLSSLMLSILAGEMMTARTGTGIGRFRYHRRDPYYHDRRFS